MNWENIIYDNFPSFLWPLQHVVLKKADLEFNGGVFLFLVEWEMEFLSSWTYGEFDLLIVLLQLHLFLFILAAKDKPWFLEGLVLDLDTTLFYP